jgi:hypothetical protein
MNTNLKVLYIRIERLCTLGTNAMSKLRIGFFFEIRFNLIPESIIIPYLLAVRANRNQPAQGFNLGKLAIDWSLVWV